MNHLAERALADLNALDRDGTVAKLGAIVAAAKHPLENVADVAGVVRQTVLRWVDAYRRGGVAGLRPRPKRPRPSKLDARQKAAVLAWLGTGKTPEGEPVRWTLKRLRAAIKAEFGVDLGASTIWVWLRKEGRWPKTPES
jgi:transposase